MVKSFFGGKKFLNSVGKEIPKKLRENSKVMEALQKALEVIAKGKL